VQLLRVLTIGVAVLAGACSQGYGTGDGYGCVPTATKVCMANYTFTPVTLSVNSGTAVTWQNGSGTTHSATSDPVNPAGCPTFDLDVPAGGTSSAVFFNQSAVSCHYYCKHHATADAGTMRVTIAVK